MASDLAKYLAAVEERASRVEDYASAEDHWAALVNLEKSQADVPTLLAMVRCQANIIEAKNGILSAYRLQGRTPERALDMARNETTQLNRLAGEAMEAKHE